MKKMMKKLCLELLACALLLPLAVVPASAEALPAAVNALVYEDDFTSAAMDERIVLMGDGVYDSESGVIKSDGTAANSGANIYFNRDKSPVTGTIVMEYTIKSSVSSWENSDSQLISQISGSGTLIDLRWYASGGDENRPKLAVVQGEANGVYHPLWYGTEGIKICIQYDTVAGTFSLWADDTLVVDQKAPRTVGKNLTHASIFANSKIPFTIENFTWYYGARQSSPEVLSTIYYDDFEDGVIDTDRISINGNITATEENGLLKTSTSQNEKATFFNLTEDGSLLTGEYVVEVFLEDSVITGSTVHRMNFGAGDHMYIDWCPGQSILRLRYFRPSSTFVTFPESMAAYGADGNTLKIAVHYNTEKSTMTVYLNDIKAWEHTYAAADAASLSIGQLYMLTYAGSVSFQSVHCYRPVPQPKTDDERIAEDYDALTEDKIFPAPLTENGYLADDLWLPTEGAEGSVISWSASADGIIDLSTGYVTRPQAEQELTLTATVSYGDGTPQTKDFTFKVPARGASPDGLPAVVSVGRREDFNEFNADVMSFRDGEVGKVAVQNGKLSISTTGVSSSAVRADIYLTEDKAEVSGQLAIEFIMTRPTGGNGLQLQLANAATTYLSDIRWNEPGGGIGFGVDYESVTAGRFNFLNFNTADFGAETRCKVTLIVDTDTGLVDFLINNKLAAESVAIRQGPISHIIMIRDNTKFSVQVDNFRFYYVETDDVRAARLDAADLSYERLIAPSEITEGVVAYDVSLPTVGNRGSDISWSSSHPDIISTDGTVTRPAADTEVTLTATVTSGAEVQTVTLKTTVLRAGDGDLVILKKDLDAVTLESILTGSLTGNDLITDDLNLYTEGAYGSTISWESTDESLIAADGTVTRPADESGNIYATLTVTVTNGDYSLSKEFRLGVLPESYSFDRVPLPERIEDVYKAEFTIHTEGEPCNTEEVDPSLTGYQVDSWSTSRGWHGVITEFNDYVEVTRLERLANDSNAGKATAFGYFLQPSTQAISDLAVTQYTLTKIGEGEVCQQIDGGSGTLALLYWQKDNTFKIRHRDAAGQLVETYTGVYEGSASITFMTDEKAGTISLWLNGDSIFYDSYPYSLGGHSLRSVGTRLEGTNYITVHVSEFDTFKAYPVAHQRPEQDEAWLTEEVIRNGIPAPAAGKLASNLNLVTEGKYGSTISWESTDESLIAADGTVNRPLDWPNEREVTVTATISYGCFSRIKEFTFNVMPIYSADESVTEKDEAFLTPENWNFFTFNDTDFSAVTTSLELPAQGPYGSTYLWKTSNSKVITSSGRVTRPRWDGGDEAVTMTVVITYGASVKSKEFTFTVLADEELKDPNHMSDEDFFGVWDGSSWSTVGKLDYTYGRNLGKVEAAAKAGDYALAKAELLSYMQNRQSSFLSTSFSRNPVYAEAFVVTGIHNSENHNHFAAMRTVTSHEYQTYEIPLSSSIVSGAKTAYKVSARYNEDSTVRIISSEHHDSELRPRVEVTVNGSRRAYVASGDTTVRGGQYRYENYSDEAEMPVRFFGAFQGDGLSDLLLQFDFSDIQTTDVVSDPQLYLTAKLDEPYATEKELVICRSGSDCDASTVTLNSMTEYTFNYNGIPGEQTWRKPSNSEAEYIIQTVRLLNQGYATAEYAYTGNEKYAYAAIYDIMDFIIDTQGRFHYTEALNAGWAIPSQDWEVLPNVVRYGAFPSALGVGCKLPNLINHIEFLKNSPYMTADVMTAILKNMWHGADELEKFLTDPVNAGMGANQRILEANAFAKTAIFMPEFHASDDLIYSAIDVMEVLMANSFFPDGAYMEATDGYASQALSDFISFWDAILKAGYDYSDEAKELLRKGVLYVAQLASNGGVSIVWGDNGKSSTRVTAKRQDYYAITGDEVINFVNTYGRQGTMPDWTSVHYESNMAAMMRSDWSDDGIFVFVPSSGWSTHGHADANSIVLNAFQRAFLIDPGYFAYGDTGTVAPERRYVSSTLGHNTVEIDNTSQRLITANGISSLVPQAEKHDWVTNDEYDFYSVTTTANQIQQVDHRRTVTFLKPNFVIVSDLMTPEVEDSAHSYKQLWHMSALGKLDSNAEERTIFSNFDAGAQLKIASADTDAVIVEADGWDTESWGVASVARYGYYHKENVAGKQTFDTVLLPYKSQGDVSAEHLVINDDSTLARHDATAMKITTTVDGEVNYTYYMLDYDHEAGAVHTFGGYETDAELAVVRTSEDGEILEVILGNGSYVKEADGAVLLVSEETVEALSYEVSGNMVKGFGSDDVVASAVQLASQREIKTLLYNKNAVEFEVESGIISMTGAASDATLEGDPNSNRGGLLEEESGGSTGGSSAGGGIGGIGGEGGQTGEALFVDIDGHWAYDSIVRMAKRGVVQGDNGYFRPDAFVTRAELVTMAVRALGLSAEGTDTGFGDVAADSWYAPYVKAALENGIISADSLFRPNDLVTREEMAKILSVSHAILKGAAFAVPESDLSFADSDAISDWARPYVLYASQNGLMNGMEHNTFAPKENGTRAQVATVLDRMLG